MRPKFFKNLKSNTSTTANRLGRGPAPTGLCARPAVLPENLPLLCVNAAAAYTGRRNACLLAKSQLQSTIAILQRSTSLSGTAVGEQMDRVSKFSAQAICNALSGIAVTLRTFRMLGQPNTASRAPMQVSTRTMTKPFICCSNGQPGTLYSYDTLMDMIQLKAIAFAASLPHHKHTHD